MTLSSNVSNSDQHFLLYFIIGTYFGPDIKEERPRKSILQRIAEGLPTYTADQLAGSHMKTVELERVYRCVLWKAKKSLAVKLSLFHHFLCGTMLTNENDPAAAYPQFPDLFPPRLHSLSRLKNKSKIIKNIIFIDDPDGYYIKPEDFERFKRLTGLDNLLLDRVAARSRASEDGSNLYNVLVCGAQQLVAEWPRLKRSRTPRKAKHAIGTLKAKVDSGHVVAPLSSVPPNSSHPKQRCTTPMPTIHDTRTEATVGPAGKGGLSLTWSALTGQTGPNIGRMDMGDCDDSYMFRVALPGVKSDEKDFSCVVDRNGKVTIEGVATTGEDVVYRLSQKFVMQSKNIGPPGEFSLTFHLPGPVNPQQFIGKFMDGILEGIVMKQRVDN